MKGVVVGGGLGGILAALLLRKKGWDVTLIEKAPKIGGLLRSWKNEFGDSFDFGTHLIGESVNQQVDELFLQEDWTRQWHTFTTPRAGCYFSGHLNEESPFPDIRFLPKPIYNQATTELINQRGLRGGPDLAVSLKGQFGNTLFDHLFSPAFHKLCGNVDLASLDARGLELFGLKRIVAFDPETAASLKALPAYQETLAYHSSLYEKASKKQYYPKEGGVGQWVDKLHQKLLDRRVQVLCGTSLGSLQTKGKQIQSVQLEGGQVLPCNTLVWTLPPAFLMRLIGVGPTTPPPAQRKTVLVHLVVDRPPTTPLQYFWNYDAQYLSGRVTLYSNLQKSSRHRITVECFLDEVPDNLTSKIEKELVQMGVVSTCAKTLFSQVHPVAQGFPIPTCELFSTLSEQTNQLHTSFNNLRVVGRGTGKAWFMEQVCTQVATELQAMEEAGSYVT